MTSLTIIYPEVTINAKNMKGITVQGTKEKPRIVLSGTASYTLIMYDTFLQGKQFIHWVVQDLSPSNPSGREILTYKPPTPPPNTGRHTYSFVLFPGNLSIAEATSLISKGKSKPKVSFIVDTTSVKGGSKRKKRQCTKKTKRQRTSSLRTNIY